MKKKLLISIFLIFTILQANIVFWACSDSCKIKNWPPDVLNNYIYTLRKVINNYNSQISKLKAKTWIQKDYSKTKTDIQTSFNKLINWDDYYTNFDFYVMYGTKNEYVSEIWRDYNLLQSEQKNLEKYYKKIISKWFDEQALDPTKLCNWIENCFLSGSALDVIMQITHNHENIMQYYKLSIIWKRILFSSDLMFVKTDFKDELYKYYNENTTRNCSKCEWWVYDRITKQIDKILNWQELARNWIKSWQDAIALLDGSLSKRQYEKVERDLLKKEVWSKWMSINASQSVLKNLDRYNQNWFSMDNNFITNSFDYIKYTVQSRIESFSETILQKFKTKTTTDIPISNFNNTKTDIKQTASIEQRIAQMYNMELPFAQIEDTSNEKLMWRIAELHYNLAQTIKALNWTVKTAQKVCNDQWRWLWNCE